MTNMKFTLITCLFLAQFFSVCAQQKMVKRFTVEDGLASNHIYNIRQDKKGYIWVATNNGVSRFDGKTFKNFSSHNGLPENDIVDIREDNSGRIWLSCFNGSACYIKHDKLFTSAEDSSLKQLEKGDYLRFINFQNKLIITHAGYGQRFVIERNGEISALPPNFENGDYLILQQYLLKIRPFNHNKTFLVDSNYQKVDSLVLTSKSHLFNQVVNTSVTDTNQFVLATSFGRLYRYAIEDSKIILKDSAETPFSIDRLYHFDSANWASHGGDQIYPIDKHLQIDTTKGIQLKGSTVYYFFIDREGNVWAGSPGNGLFLIPNNNFHHYSDVKTIHEDNIENLAGHQNEVFIGHRNGRVQSLYGGDFYQSSHNEYQPRTNNIVSLLATEDYLIAGLQDPAYITIIDKKRKAQYFTNFGNTKCLHHWKPGSFLIGTSSRCCGIELPNTVTDTIFFGRTTAVCPLEEHKILVGTLHGLFLCSKDSQGKWSHDSASTYPLFENSSISYLETMGQTIAVGTQDHGLVVLRGTELVQVDLQDNGQNANCRKVVFDGPNTIWVASYSGVYKVKFGNTLHSYTVEHISKANGLLSNYVNDLLLVGDSLFVATPEGLSVCSKSNWNKGYRPPQIWINDISVNNRPYNWASPEIELPFDSNNISFSFSAIDFKSLGNAKCKYRLIGLNERWQHTSTSTIRYESLNPGTYTYEVSGMNGNKQWSIEPARLTFTVLPPWWKTKAAVVVFFVLMIGLIIGLVWKVFEYRNRQALRATLLKKHMTEIELKAIKAQINPHFLFNSLNSIQYFVNSGKNEEAEIYLTNMANLLREILDFSGKTEVKIADEIDFLENFLSLEKLRFSTPFIHTIKCSPKPEIYQVKFPAMVLQPHIENALKHGLKPKTGHAHHLQIRFRLNKQILICEIEDNGIGRAAAMKHKKMHLKQHSSKGIELSDSKLKMYAELTGHGVKTEIIDLYEPGPKKLPQGTLIRITINHFVKS